MMRIDDSYQGGIAVTPSDTVNITFPNGTQYTKGIYVAVAGNVSAVMASGQTIAFTSLPAGFHRLAVIRINATGTAATGIVALY